jgi:hypothetical protein
VAKLEVMHNNRVKKYFMGCFQTGQGRKWSSLETSGQAGMFNTVFLNSLAADSPHKGMARSLNLCSNASSLWGRSGSPLVVVHWP